MKQIKCLKCGQITNVAQLKSGEKISCSACSALLTAIPENADTVDSKCGYCGAEIAPGDVSVFCPECGLEFHHDCWVENQGCATYGCSQVGCLKPKPTPLPVSIPVPVPQGTSAGNFGTGIPQPQGMSPQIALDNEKARSAFQCVWLTLGYTVGIFFLLLFFSACFGLLGKISTFLAEIFNEGGSFIWQFLFVVEDNTTHSPRWISLFALLIAGGILQIFHKTIAEKIRPLIERFTKKEK